MTGGLASVYAAQGDSLGKAGVPSTFVTVNWEAKRGNHWIKVLMQVAIEKKIKAMFGVDLDHTKPGNTPVANQIGAELIWAFAAEMATGCFTNSRTQGTNDISSFHE